MEVEKKLLGAALASKDAFGKLTAYGSVEDLSQQGGIIWKAIEEYYSIDPETNSVDKETIVNRLGKAYPKHKDLFETILGTIDAVSVPNVIEDAVKMRELGLRDKLSAAFASGSDEQIEHLLEEYNSIKKEEGELNNKIEVYNNVAVESLLESVSTANRIKVLPKQLNEALRGGVLRQHHIVIFAPTDMGKSLFSMNMVAGFLMQNLRVLYCGNEDPAQDMLTRLAARVSGTTLYAMEKNEAKVQENLIARNWHNLFFVELSPGTPQEIEACIEEYQPDVLIVDQIRNLEMGEKNFVRTLEAAAQFMRRMGKKYRLVPISLTQAADSATGKNFLTRGDIDNSNVGIPGTADLMIGIGADADTEAEGYRWLSLVKNKVSGNKNPIKVKFDPTRTRVD